MGDVVSVSAQLASFIQHVMADGQPVTPTNDLASLLLGFTSGAQATIQVSGVAHLGERQMQQTTFLYGDAGTLETRFNFGGSGFQVRGLRYDEAEFSEQPIPGAMLKGATAENPLGIFREQPIGPRQFVDSILNDQPIAPGLDEGYKTQQVIDAALKSHETGQRVLIS
jgi:predicted dehydrogenase